MKNIITLIKNSVNLESYSSSKAFLGFSEEKGHPDFDTCNHAIDLLISNFPVISSKCFTVSSLHYDNSSLKEFFELSDEDIGKYYHPLVEQKIVTKVDYDSISRDYSSSYFERKQRELDNNFTCINNLSKNYLKKTLYLVMAIDGVQGHLFLYLKKDELIIYPHDDIGFGFISLAKDNVQLLEKLKNLFNNDVMHMKITKLGGSSQNLPY